MSEGREWRGSFVFELLSENFAQFSVLPLTSQMASQSRVTFLQLCNLIIKILPPSKRMTVT